jgi:hypothetical protein
VHTDILEKHNACISRIHPRKTMIRRLHSSSDRCQVLLPKCTHGVEFALFPQGIRLRGFKFLYLWSDMRHISSLYWENGEARCRMCFPPPSRFFLPHLPQPAVCKHAVGLNVSFRVPSFVTNTRYLLTSSSVPTNTKR